MKKKNASSHGGLARRWTLRITGIVGVFLLILIVCLTLVTRHFAYKSVERSLCGQADTLVQLYEAAGSGNTAAFTAHCVTAVGASDDVQAAALNPDGTVLAVSSGTAEDYLAGDDYQAALRSKNGQARWVGTLPNGSYVMAVTTLLYDSGGQLAGGVRYLSPLGGAAKTVLLVCAGMVAGGLALLLAVILVSNRFVKRLTAPIKEINFTANKIAQGDFNIRLEKEKDDEIGELCDAINDMAVSLDTMENMKNEFISSVSHELRTPLTAIKGWAETMQCGEMDQQTFDRGINVIIRESERLSGIVEELLDFSRMQSGKMKTNMQRTDLLEDLGESVYLFTDRAKAERKFLLYDAPKSLPPVYGDINRLRQVFVNIIDNALKYTDEGGTISVSAKESDGFIYITVADNGCGIPAEHLPNVRRKFYKANQSIRGSGIGLALADEIMALHAGGLEIESHEGLGTAVTISIPTYENLQRQRQKMHG